MGLASHEEREGHRVILEAERMNLFLKHIGKNIKDVRGRNQRHTFIGHFID